MTRYCMDTSAYSHFRRGASAAVGAISSARWLGVPSIVLGELRTGFLVGGQRAEKERRLSHFLAHPVVEVLTVDSETAGLYAEIMVSLRQAGTPIPSNDIWIAAVAAQTASTVLTYDDHFRSIHRVAVEILQ
ncbi:MAG: type II toxin-antitoxin system VapC family toxin [Acidobacteria bacterium]|nr:MAG: type II toxin-antitoxin system VapC family toxin [Acidobacteriota bacterium]